MEKNNLRKETELLIAESFLKNFEINKFIDWSVRLLERGYNSANLLILAGLDNEDSIVIEKYFKLSCSDLRIDFEINKKILMDKYLIYIVEGTIEKKFTIEQAANIFQEIIEETSYKEYKYFDWIYLYDELEDLTGIEAYKYVINKFKTFINELENKQ